VFSKTPLQKFETHPQTTSYYFKFRTLTFLKPGVGIPRSCSKSVGLSVVIAPFNLSN
jgi:hypothetical protein